MIDWVRRKWALYWLLFDDRTNAKIDQEVERARIRLALWRGEGPYG